jgi:hypothetical protein
MESFLLFSQPHVLQYTTNHLGNLYTLVTRVLARFDYTVQ